MTATIKFETDNAAFVDDFASELAFVLRQVKAHHALGHVSGILRDSNGNTVGVFNLNEEEAISEAKRKLPRLRGAS